MGKLCARFISAQTIHNPPTKLTDEERKRRKANRKRARARKMRRGW